jgi:hypothetical protein
MLISVIEIIHRRIPKYEFEIIIIVDVYISSIFHINKGKYPKRRITSQRHCFRVRVGLGLRG